MDGLDTIRGQENSHRGARQIATGLEAALLGLCAAGCRMICQGEREPTATPEPWATGLDQRMSSLGGILARVHGLRQAALMAAGAALAGQPAALLTRSAPAALAALLGLDAPVTIVDLSERLALDAGRAALLAPHHTGAAFGMAAASFDLARLRRSPVVIGGLTGLVGPLLIPNAAPEQACGFPPIHHDGPDNPELLLVGAGPGFEACVAARDQLEEDGVQAAHLHLLQLRPFPAAIVAPAFSSAARLLVVEPGRAPDGQTLSTLIRGALSPRGYLHELRTGWSGQVSADQILATAREVLLR